MTVPTVAPAATTKQNNPVGLAALIVGAVALLFAIIPVASFIAWLPAVAAIILGIVGLVLKNRKRAFAWTGIALGAVAWIVAIVVSVAGLASLAGSVNDAIESSTPVPVASEPAAIEESAAPSEPADAPVAEPETPTVPTDYVSALAQATLYSETLHLSKAGIYDQLVSEYGGKFAPEAAQYAIDNVQADWNANALATAKQYQETMSMSSEAIRDQLTSVYGSKFTPEEADYAVANLA